MMAEQQKTNESPINWGPATILAGSALMLWSLGIILSHAISWLKLGYWPSYAVYELQDDIFGRRLETSWVGVQRLIIWWQSTSAANSLFWIGMGLACWGGFIGDEHDAQKRRQKDREWLDEQQRKRAN